MGMYTTLKLHGDNTRVITEMCTTLKLHGDNTRVITEMCTTLKLHGGHQKDARYQIRLAD
jgi:uncharacterized Rossmann fold enzyme